MKYLVRLAIHRPVTTAMFYLALILMGIIALFRLEINLLPDLEFPRITIITLYAHAAPVEVENLISKPIAESVGTINGIEKISSESVEGISFVSLQFSWGTNIDYAAMEVREKVDLIRGILPEDASKSVVTKFDPNQSPIADIVFFPKELSNEKDLRYFLRTEVKNFLDRIDGVASVQFSGGYEKEIQIRVDPVRLTSYHLSLQEVSDAIAASNVNYPAGIIKKGRSDILIRTLGEYKRKEDIGYTLIGRNDQGVAIRLNSVAEVFDSYKERTGLARYNGQESVLASFYKEAGRNTVEVADNIKQTIRELRERFNRELDIRLVYDQSRFVQNSIDNISQSLLIGGILGFLSLLLILRNFRSPMILISAVPISVLATFLLMHLQGISLNIMSLGGLSLGIGMLFDSGNVVLSAIELRVKEGKNPKEAAMEGAINVAGSITAAILTTVIVFLPIVFLEGVVGVVFADMALTICFSLGVSLLVSTSLIPMLSSLRGISKTLASKSFDIDQKTDWKVKSSRVKNHVFAIMENQEKRLENLYEKNVLKVLRNPLPFLLLVVGGILLVIFLYPFLDQEFIPKVDTGEFEIVVRNPKGTSLQETASIVSNIENELAKHKVVEHTISYIGYDEDQILSQRSGSVGTNQARIKVILFKNRAVSTKEFVQKIRKNISFRKEIKIYMNLSGDILSSLLSPEARPVTLEIKGDDLDMLSLLGNKIKGDLADVPGIVDLNLSLEEKDREYHVYFRQDRLSFFNLDKAYISTLLRTAIKGEVATRLRVADEEIKVRIRYRENYRKSLEDVLQFRIKTGDDRFITLDQVIDIKSEEGYTSIIRSDQNRINRITANIENSGLQEVNRQLEKYIASLKLPQAYNIDFGGERKNMESSFQELLFAMGLAVVLIYMVLASQFESLIFPFIMMGSIPLIIIGVVPALLLLGKSLNIGSFTGLILLVGMVVDNGALFYEYVELHLKEGLDLVTAITRSGKIVLKPILMNNGTTMLGLLPIALELGEGTEFQSPMAITVIGGMFASVVLSLFIIPMALYLFKKGKVSVHSDLK